MRNEVRIAFRRPTSWRDVLDSTEAAIRWIRNEVSGDATPNPEVSKAQQAKALKDAANDPKVKEQYRKLGFETVGDGPQETLKRLRDETDMWRKTIEAAAIKVN